jgi:hypothetical protein
VEERSSGQPDAHRSSVLGSIWRGTKSTARAPFSAFPFDQIRQNARLITDLSRRLRPRPDPELRVFRTDAGRLDLQATAFDFGLSPQKLQARIASRRRQTARLAYASFILGCGFVVLWMYRAVTSDLGGPRFVNALQFIPFCAIFFLVALKNAHVNWQLRTGQFGSAGEYLRSPAPFWPS